MISKQKTRIDFQVIYSSGAPFEAAGLKAHQRRHMNMLSVGMRYRTLCHVSYHAHTLHMMSHVCCMTLHVVVRHTKPVPREFREMY